MLVKNDQKIKQKSMTELNWDGYEDQDLNWESDNPLERPFEVEIKPVHPAETRYPHLRK